MVLLFSHASVQTSKVKLIREFQNSDYLWLTWLNLIPWLHADGSDCKFLTTQMFCLKIMPIFQLYILVLFENHRTWFALFFSLFLLLTCCG